MVPTLRGCARTLAAVAAVTGLALSTPAARAADPPLTVSQGKLAGTLRCPLGLTRTGPTPVLFITGTDVPGDTAFSIGEPAFRAFGRPVCYVQFPDNTTADVQDSVQYLVHGVRVMARRAHRRIALFGTSQGGLLPQVALTYWPSLRRKVTDVISAAGTHHGTDEPRFTRCPTLAEGCAPAVWQQTFNSDFLKALNRQPDETPGPTAWTAVYSSTDEVVQPQTGPHPTSSLRGATNVLLQAVCPGRQATHLGTVLDGVTAALVRDAVDHAGPARVARLPKDICNQKYAPGFDTAALDALTANFEQTTDALEADVPHFKREPPVRAWARRRVR